MATATHPASCLKGYKARRRPEATKHIKEVHDSNLVADEATTGLPTTRHCCINNSDKRHDENHNHKSQLSSTNADKGDNDNKDDDDSQFQRTVSRVGTSDTWNNVHDEDCGCFSANSQA
jgi:hypothetical protein